MCNFVARVKINDGSLALRRWFVESNPQRRSILVTYKLVSKQRSTRTMGNADNPNVWTIARRRDKALWTEGQRHHSRLSWLNAPQSAFDGASTYKTDMQKSTCNWSNACALREYAESNCGTALCSWKQPRPSWCCVPYVFISKLWCTDYVDYRFNIASRG